MTNYRVTAPYVLLKLPDHTGKVQVHDFYQGAILDGGKLDEDSLKRHLDRGMVEKADFGEAPEADESSEGDDSSDKPGQNDRKEVWVDYAVAQGYKRDEAEEMSKSDLIELFK